MELFPFYYHKRYCYLTKIKIRHTLSIIGECLIYDLRFFLYFVCFVYFVVTFYQILLCFYLR
jgi:hypothetical protein